MADTSTSVEASASAAEVGFIWSMKGQAKAAAPTAPMAPDATYRKSRRVPASCVVAATGSILEREMRKEGSNSCHKQLRERTDAVTRQPPFGPHSLFVRPVK